MIKHQYPIRWKRRQEFGKAYNAFYSNLATVMLEKVCAAIGKSTPRGTHYKQYRELHATFVVVYTKIKNRRHTGLILNSYFYYFCPATCTQALTISSWFFWWHKENRLCKYPSYFQTFPITYATYLLKVVRIRNPPWSKWLTVLGERAFIKQKSFH